MKALLEDGIPRPGGAMETVRGLPIDRRPTGRYTPLYFDANQPSWIASMPLPPTCSHHCKKRWFCLPKKRDPLRRPCMRWQTKWKLASKHGFPANTTASTIQGLMMDGSIAKAPTCDSNIIHV